ncbi:MAG: glutamine synthetase family protein [Actinomycetes bacterium]|jgi:glutamine synthetase|nr:glutamine synthetase family protein [Actinomycetes bacterium]
MPGISKEVRDEIIRKIEDANVEFIHLWFTDVLGFLKTLVLSIDELENALTEGMGFDGSSIQGFARIFESDMIALPDPDTLLIQKWRQTDENIAIMFCNVVTPEGEAFEGDPREVLKQQLRRAAALGYKVFLGPECEFFYLTSAEDPQVLDQAGYFDQSARDLAFDLRSETVHRLRQFGIEVEYSHHEVAPSQHEIDLRYKEALKMADQVVIYKTLVSETAALNGVYATFMPKPLNGVNGSGMHVHQSLFQDGRNAFYDPEGKWQLSQVARHYIGGLLKHARGIALLTNQWVNSYKRLVAGFEAPVYISWAHLNRSALVRVPLYKPGKEAATRVELRMADPACNPYLAFAAMIAAGLDGIENQIEPPEDIDFDAFALSVDEVRAKGIDLLPGDLNEAINAFVEDETIREAMGPQVTDYIIANKRQEWDDFRTQVTPWELENYLPKL